MSVALLKRGSSALTHLLTVQTFFCEFSKTFKITYFMKYIHNTASVNVIFLKADLKIALFSQKFTILSRKLKLFYNIVLIFEFSSRSFYIFSCKNRLHAFLGLCPFFFHVDIVFNNFIMQFFALPLKVITSKNSRFSF